MMINSSDKKNNINLLISFTKFVTNACSLNGINNNLLFHLSIRLSKC